MNADSPELSIILPAYNEEQLLPGTLDALKKAFGTLPGFSYEIIVCDNNSSDHTSDVARAHGARVVFEPHNQIARARNSGAKTAQGRWLLFVDADTTVSPDLAGLLLATLRQGRIAAGGALIRFDMEKIPPTVRWVIGTWNALSRFCGLAAGSFVFCPRRAWEETGGFDESYYAGEEIFFSLRLKRWCRENKVKFKVLRAAAYTSSRKLLWHSQKELWRVVFRAALPGAIKDRSRCAFWYERPSETKL